MSSVVTHNFRLYAANQFIESLSEASATVMYVFVGRPQPWDQDAFPTEAYDNEYSFSAIWDDMMSIKRVQPSDAILAIRRNDWSSGTVYDEYRHNYSPSNVAYSGASNLYDSNFYVINNENNVYKCISNNNDSKSTEQPTGTSLVIFNTADGYRWKYMYTVSTSDLQKFEAFGYIPVSTNETVRAAAIDGAIHRIRVVDGGGGITTPPALEITGDGTGASATSVLENSIVSGVNMSNFGSGYRTATVNTVSGVILEAIIEPPGGHGYDAVSELGARYVIVNVKLEYEEQGSTFTIKNDYRRIGILQDPLNYGTHVICTASDLAAMKSLTLSSGVIGTFLSDEIISGNSSNANALVVDYDSATRVLRYIQNSETGYLDFDISETVLGDVSGAAGTIASFSSPGVKKNSGSIIYAENRVPITRTSDQIDSVSFVIKF